MKIIAVANQKGGVGKTTSAAALASGLIVRGRTSLIIDTDPQGNLSLMYGARISGVSTLYDVLGGEAQAADAIQATKQGDIIASSPRLVSKSLFDDADGNDDPGRAFRLREAIETLRDRYDHIVIDTPPALGDLTINALTASDTVIITAQADLFSAQGIRQLDGTIKRVRQYINRDLQVAGVLITRYNARSNITRDSLDAIERHAADAMKSRVFTAKIRECSALKEAQADGERRSIYDYAPKSNASVDYLDFIDELLRSDDK